MSESTLGDEARALILAGAEKWIDHWGGDVSGSVVTGWLLVVEGTDTAGRATVTWSGGNGMPTAGDGGGIARHRVAGLAAAVVREIDAMEVGRYVKGNE